MSWLQHIDGWIHRWSVKVKTEQQRLLCYWEIENGVNLKGVVPNPYKHKFFCISSFLIFFFLAGHGFTIALLPQTSVLRAYLVYVQEPYSGDSSRMVLLNRSWLSELCTHRAGFWTLIFKSNIVQSKRKCNKGT